MMYVFIEIYAVMGVERPCFLTDLSLDSGVRRSIHKVSSSVRA